MLKKFIYSFTEHLLLPDTVESTGVNGYNLCSRGNHSPMVETSGKGNP
jgi:hypothetical protein